MHTHNNLTANLTAQTNGNIMKTWVLMGVFLAGVTGLGFFISQLTGSSTYLYGALATSLAMNVFAYFNSASIALKSAGAQPADKEEYKDLYAMVEDLATQMKIPAPQLYIVNDEAPNAFATGRSPAHAHVAVTTGIMKRLSRDELRGVLAHELSHVSNRDILVMTVAVVLVGVLSLFANMALHASSYNKNREGGGGGLALIITLLASVLAPIAAQLLQMSVSRRREYLADSTGALVTGEPAHLASALEKIGSYSAPMKHASYTTAHLFISNPFGHARMGQFLAGLFSTHPPIHERVRILRGE